MENGMAYKDEVIPTISFDDVNYESYEVRLLRTRMDEQNVDVTAEFIQGLAEQAQGGSGTYDTFEKKVENDGIYTLTVRVTDMAGNEEMEEVTFSVNRFGSVYVYSNYLASLIKDGGQYITIQEGEDAAITEDLIITEYNPDRLLDDSLQILLTRDGEPVDAVYTSSPEVNSQAGIGSSGWYQYEYRIDAGNFAEDGVYKISLTSAYATTDSARNESTSVPENSMDQDGNAIVDNMTFTVDTTAPEIRNVVNMDEAIVNAQSLDVDYTMVDVGGLKSIEVIVDDETIENITDVEENRFQYTGSFTIEESSRPQNVELRVTDLAGNVTDTASDDFSTGGLYEFNGTITVSTNFLVRWYANKPLFWGTIALAVVLIGVILFIVAYRRRKQEEITAK